MSIFLVIVENIFTFAVENKQQKQKIMKLFCVDWEAIAVISGIVSPLLIGYVVYRYKKKNKEKENIEEGKYELRGIYYEKIKNSGKDSTFRLPNNPDFIKFLINKTGKSVVEIENQINESYKTQHSAEEALAYLLNL